MKKYIFLFIFITIISCKNNECEDVLCFTPPPTFELELVDKTTGENLFTNDVLNPNDIKILDENSKNIAFNFISENDLNIIQLSEIGWNLGAHTYKVTVGIDVQFNIELEMKEKHENCCTFFNTLQFNISNYEFEQSNTSGVYTIKID